MKAPTPEEQAEYIRWGHRGCDYEYKGKHVVIFYDPGEKPSRQYMGTCDGVFSGWGKYEHAISEEIRDKIDIQC